MRIKQLKRWINADNGEIIFDREEDMDFYLLTDKGYLMMNNKPTVRIYPGIEWPVASGDKSKLIDLAAYLHRSGALMRKDRGIHAMTIPMMGKAIGLSGPRTYSWVRRLIVAGVIRKDEGIFYVNPMYMTSSSRVSADLYRIFQVELAAYIPDWAKGKLLNEDPSNV